MLEAPKHDVWIQHRTSFNYFLPILRVAATTWSTWPLPPCKSSEMSSWNARALQKCHLALNFKLIVSDRCDLQKGFKPPCFNCCFPHVCSRAGMSQSRIVWNIWNQIPWVRRFEEGRGAGFPRFFATQTAAKGLHKALAVNLVSYDKSLKALWCLCAACFVIEIVSLASLAFMVRYDTTTVIDLVHAADLYLWGGAGFSSGKVSYLWTQRDEMFKGPCREVTGWTGRTVCKIIWKYDDYVRKYKK